MPFASGGEDYDRREYGVASGPLGEGAIGWNVISRTNASPTPEELAIPQLAQDALEQSAAGVGKRRETELPERLRNVGEAALLSATGEPSSAALQWRAEPWPEENSVTLAVALFSLSDAQRQPGAFARAPHLFVLELKGGAVVVRGRGELVPSASSCIHHEESSDVDLTIAPTSPKLTDKRGAFAVRVTCINEYPGSTGSTTELFLFDWQGEALAQVLETVLDRTAFDRVSGKEVSEEGTLTALPSKADDYSDMMVKVKRVERTALLEGDQDSEQATSRRVLSPTQTRYTWDGRRYQRVDR